MEKFKFKYKRKGNNNKPEMELQFMGGAKDYAFEVMSLITMLMCIVHNDNKDVYSLVKTYMLDKDGPLYSDACLKGLYGEVNMQNIKREEGDAHDEV